MSSTYVFADDSEKKRLKSLDVLGVDSTGTGSSHTGGTSSSSTAVSTDTKPPIPSGPDSRVADLKPDISGRVGDDLPSCQVINKARTSITQPLSSNRMKSPSTTSSRGAPIQISPQCQYPLPQSTSPYLQAGSPGCEQVYYPHHTPANSMAAMQMANSGLLQPVSSASSLLQPASGLSLSGHMSQQMQTCQLSGQNSACALAQASSSIPSAGYGLAGAGGSQGHSGLPSCTYMQNPQSYPGHLATSMSVMNMATASHFPGPMA